MRKNVSNMQSLIDARTFWAELGYGMFIHFGPNTFSGQAWGDGTTPATMFNPDRLDVLQWAEMARKAGMTYAVLTAKHHDGFCLWPTRYTDYSVKGAPSGIDVVKEYVEAFRSVGIKPGLYYSLWDRNCSSYEDDNAYAQYMKGQLEELLTGYGDILELWFDGGWDKDYPSKSWTYEPGENDAKPDGRRWRWRELYDLIHSLQKDCLVIQNSSSNKPGNVNYMPVDIRTSEHYNFIFKGKLCRPDDNATVIDEATQISHTLPLEFCTTLTPGWFWSEKSWFSHHSAACIADWRLKANEMNGNLLLNIGPDKHGLMPDYHEEFLVKAREMFDQANLDRRVMSFMSQSQPGAEPTPEEIAEATGK